MLYCDRDGFCRSIYDQSSDKCEHRPLSAITSPGGFIGSMENVASHAFLMYMIISIAIILAVTSFFMTKWIQRGVFDPINRLNLAMKKISSGNLDYALETNSEDTSEIGDLYNNYEEMRLRLKESAFSVFPLKRKKRWIAISKRSIARQMIWIVL